MLLKKGRRATERLWMQGCARTAGARGSFTILGGVLLRELYLAQQQVITVLCSCFAVSVAAAVPQACSCVGIILTQACLVGSIIWYRVSRLVASLADHTQQGHWEQNASSGTSSAESQQILEGMAATAGVGH